jgi:uncharacterized protein YyaL (SSP411 family)
LQAIRRPFLPNKVVALKSTGPEVQPAEDAVELLAGKEAKGEVTTYICQNFTCQEPLVGVEAVEVALATKGE